MTVKSACVDPSQAKAFAIAFLFVIIFILFYKVEKKDNKRTIQEKVFKNHFYFLFYSLLPSYLRVSRELLRKTVTSGTFILGSKRRGVIFRKKIFFSYKMTMLTSHQTQTLISFFKF